MDISTTSLGEVIIITPKIFHDSRGFFLESFHASNFAAAGITASFVQDNHSRSKRGVLRGLHYQIEQPQGKLVSVMRGRIFDVAADIRVSSPTYGKWVGVILDDVKRNALWIPPGYAHGFCALSEDVDVVYKCTDYYNPRGERGIRWDDPTLSVEWPIKNPLVSEKDGEYPLLSSGLNELPMYEGPS